jgi:hypothetical protein
LARRETSGLFAESTRDSQAWAAQYLVKLGLIRTALAIWAKSNIEQRGIAYNRGIINPPHPVSAPFDLAIALTPFATLTSSARR